MIIRALFSDLCGDAPDEALDVELRGAGLLAGRVGALEAAARLAQRRTLRQRRVLDVVKVLEQGRAGTERDFTLSRRLQSKPFILYDMCFNFRIFLHLIM